MHLLALPCRQLTATVPCWQQMLPFHLSQDGRAQFYMPLRV